MTESILKKISAFFSAIDPFNYADQLLDRFYPLPKHEEPPLLQNAIYQLVYLLVALLTALLIYGIASVALQTSSPIVIVVSESMEPQLFRGDLVVLHGVSFENLKADLVNLDYSIENQFFNDFASIDYETNTISFKDSNQIARLKTDNDIIVYNSTLLGRQIIHRAQAKISSTNGDFVLTKGDNEKTNATLDQDCGKVIVLPITSSPTPQLRVEKACVNPLAPSRSDVLGKSLLRVPLVGCFKLWLFDDLPTLLTRQQLPADFKGIC